MMKHKSTEQQCTVSSYLGHCVLGIYFNSRHLSFSLTLRNRCYGYEQVELAQPHCDSICFGLYPNTRVVRCSRLLILGNVALSLR